MEISIDLNAKTVKGGLVREKIKNDLLKYSTYTLYPRDDNGPLFYIGFSINLRSDQYVSPEFACRAYLTHPTTSPKVYICSDYEDLLKYITEYIIAWIDKKEFTRC
jgi:hypothetical protein